MNTDYRGRKERIDVAGRLHVDGHSYSDIAEKLGVSERTARRDVKASGVEVRRNAPAPYSHEMRQEMCDLYKRGKSITQTAEELDVSRTAVQHALEVFGVQARSRSKANALRWQDEEFRRNQIEKRKGKETWNKGRTYTQANPAKERPEVRGENNGQWKGGKTKLGRRIRNLPRYARWRTSVFERDDYTCQECGRRSRKGDKVILHAHHHEDSFASLLDKHSIVSLGDAHECDVLWRKEIAITLCRKCHRNTETYGANHG